MNESELEEKSEQFWNSLSKEQQLDAFCAMTRRMYKGEIEMRGTFRKVLYDVFNFGPEAYTLAYNSGYFQIHNTITNHDDEYYLVDYHLSRFAEENGIEKEKVDYFMKKFHSQM